jgi:hypothetical protein
MGHQTDPRELRKFGLTVGGVFAAIGFWPTVIRGHGPRLWAVALAVALVVPALLLPQSLGAVHRLWMGAAEILGRLNTRLILGLTFYVLITPMGLVMRRVATDPMRRGFEPGARTYRVLRRPRPGTHMTRQF